jgi:hypothetical protein
MRLQVTPFAATQCSGHREGEITEPEICSCSLLELKKKKKKKKMQSVTR